MATTRQKLVLQKMSENVGFRNKTKSQILKEAGYSQSICNSPNRIFESKFFKEYFDDNIADINVIESHAKLLHAKKLISIKFPAELSEKDVKNYIKKIGKDIKVRQILQKQGVNNIQVAYCIVPDCEIQLRAIDMAYRVKGLYKHPLCERVQKLNNPITLVSDSDLIEEVLTNFCEKRMYYQLDKKLLPMLKKVVVEWEKEIAYQNTNINA